MYSGAQLLYRCSKFRNQTPNVRISFAVAKNCVSHVYTERIHSTIDLQNTHVHNNNAKSLFRFIGQNACSPSQHHLGRNFRTQPKLHRRTLQSKPQKLLKVFCSRTQRVFAMHSGSTHTWIAENIAEDFGLPGEKQTIRILASTTKTTYQQNA